MAILLSKKRSIDRNVSRRIVKMFLIQFVFCLCFFTSIASGVTQNRVVNLDFENVELSKALKSLSEAANCKFVFNYDDLNNYKVSAKLENKSVEECLDILLARVPFKYSQEGELIVISYKSNDEKKIYKVRGVVKDETGMPLPGVAVIQKGTTLGAATDVDGRFEFQLTEKNVTLVFSFVGMKTKELLYDGSDKLLDVTMEEEVEMLGEVVATGYQTISRERSTGSVTILKAEDLRKVQGTSLVSKIEGLTPGLSTYGDKLEMRGTSSFAVSSTPLLVVDGIVMNQGLNSINPDDVETITVLKDAAATSLYGVRASNGVIVITTKKGKSDKVNFDLSAGFYINPLPKLSYMDYASTSDIIDFELEFLLNNDLYKQNPGDYFDDKNQTTSSKPYTRIERYYYELYKGNMTQVQVDEKINAMRKNDYRKEARKLMSETALTQNYNLSISKGGEKSNLYFSLRYEDNGKYLKSDVASQYSIYLKNELNLTDWFTLTYGANTYIAKMKESMSGISYLDVMPYEKVLTDEGNPVYQYGYNFYRSIEIDETEGLEFMGFNLNEERNNNMQKTNSLYVRLFADADFKLWKGLDLGVKFQYERKNINIKQFDEADSYKMRELVNRYTSGSVGNFVYNLPQGGHLSENNQNEEYFNFRAQLNYQTTMGEKHDLTVLAGAEIRGEKAEGIFEKRYGYDPVTGNSAMPVPKDPGNGEGFKYSDLVSYANAMDQLSGQEIEENRFASFYGALDYSLFDRYVLNVSFRTDGSNNFGSDEQFNPTWSAGAVWHVSEETFMEVVRPVLSRLSLRVATGYTGNINKTVKPNLMMKYYKNFRISDDENYRMGYINNAPNPKLRWEKTRDVKVALDFGLWKDRINGIVEAYWRKSKDCVTSEYVPVTTGFFNQSYNTSVLQNNGVEFSLSVAVLKSKDYNLSVSANVAWNQNKLKKYNSPNTSLALDKYVGYPMGAVFSGKYEGIDPETGMYKFKLRPDAVTNKDGYLREPNNYYYYLGTSVAPFTGGFNLNFSSKNIGLSVGGSYSVKAKMVDNIESPAGYELLSGSKLESIPTPHNDLYRNHLNVKREVRNRWTPENRTGVKYPRLIDAYGKKLGLDLTNPTLTTITRGALLEDISYLRINTIALSYSLPQRVLERINFSSAALNLTLNNFFTITKYSGIDPEVPGATYPVSRSVTIGLNVGF